VMSDDSQQNQTRLWRSLSQAVGAELREARTIRGASGIEHPVQAIAVDDKDGRVIIVSAEYNARVAALMQGDIQATMSGVNVLVARPIAVDLAALARALLSGITNAQLTVGQFKAKLRELQSFDETSARRYFEKNVSGIVATTGLALKKATLPMLSQVIGVAQRLAYVEWDQVLRGFSSDTPNDEIITFERLVSFDNLAIYRQFGVCAIPLYELKEDDYELFYSSKLDDVRERLRALNIYQYFYPAPDQLALGVVDNGINSQTDKHRAAVGGVERAGRRGVGG
jgi:hypothetical protein